MADIIKCPVCGESNLPDQEFCQYCQSRLQPLTGNLKGADAPIKPGQMPTKKNTAELEPILPQWLRDARDSARKSAEDDAAQAGRQPNESYSSASPSSSDDLLAGLHSQAGSEEEETPDWLANITGAAPKPKKPQTDSPEVRWVELGGAKDFAQEEPKVAEPEPFMPSWLEGLTPTEPQRDEKDELTDWFRQTDDSQKSQQPESQPPAFDTSISVRAEQPGSDDTPDWLKKMAAESAQSNDALFSDSGDTFNTPSSDTPDWLRQMAADAGEPTNDLNVTPSDTSDAPDWLHQMVADDSAPNENIQTLSAGTFDAPQQKTDDAPDWLRAMGTLQDPTPSADSVGFSETGVGESEAAVSSNEDVPDWMKSFPPVESEKPSQSTTPSWLKEEKPDSSTAAEVPAWLSAAQEPEQQQPPATEPEFGDIPSWLKASAPQSSIYESPSAESTSEPASSSSESPDWLQAFKSLDTTASQPSKEFPSDISSGSTSQAESPDWMNAFKSLDTTASQPSTQFPSDAPFEAVPPAFTPDSQTSENLDALFTDMPDWLSSTSDASPSASSSSPSAPPTPTTPTEGLTPGELPSWVQAMRPVDTGNSLRSTLVAGLSGDQTLESRGALAGLQGVLPSVPGYAPTSKPKAYSIKLQASEEQQAHATLLEQILSAETQPVPIASFSALTTSRGLRWFITAAVFIVLITAFFLPTHLFPLPVGTPFEIGGAVQVAKSIPQGAPVLVAFDYEPARAGEMEAAAAPIFSLLDQPNLTFISTNETGSILAERFISGLLIGPAEKSGFPYLNLGYLPGGQMGIRALAQDPARTFSALQGISSLSQFTALIIITDSADSARMWIEQTSSAGGKTPIVIISSAQAAPMIQPYYDSQQISGLVSGLYGSAVLEKNNGDTSGVAQTYWDAYSVGMLLAVVVITGGALWSFVLGMRNRAAMGETK